MHLQQEDFNTWSIQAYTADSIKVQDKIYNESLIITNEGITTYWPIHHISELDETLLFPFTHAKPDVILIGHNALGERPPQEILRRLDMLRIGFEAFNIGAACRTFNVLLGENRNVALGIIW